MLRESKYKASRFAIAVLATTISCGFAVSAAVAGESPQLQRLIDIEDIKQLRARFANAIDNRRWEELRALLAKNCVVDVPGAMLAQENHPAEERARIVGDDAIIAFVHKALGDKPGGSHAVTIPIIEIRSATTATGIWRLGTATYFDSYSKIDGRWRMQTIRFEPTEPGSK
jgi:SnoaL-like domain